MSPSSKISDRIPVLNEYIQHHGRAPTTAELCSLYGVRSMNTAHMIAKGFVRAGVLNRTATGRLVAPPHRAASTLRLLGSVAAGFPSPAEEALLDTMTLDEYLIPKPTATYMLRVEGDSMIDAGILPGDVVLVERGRTVRNGNIVIACIDGAWTMKYFYKDKDGVRLEAANKNYKTIRPKHKLEVEGVVSSVIRKLV